MANTTNKLAPSQVNGAANGGALDFGSCDVPGPASYSTGGIAVAAADLGLRTVTSVLSCTITTPATSAFTAGAAVAAVYNTSTNKVMFIGETGVESTATTVLTGMTVRVIAVGKK
jgi:alpha-D-ribose 1-methylphosphonate 5-phosphate C-P lyase